MNIKNTVFLVPLSISILTLGANLTPASLAAVRGTQEAAQPAIAKRIGAIKAINGSVITLATASGPEVAVTVLPNARILRIVPGEKDLKNAATLSLQDLQVGDTVRVRGQASEDAKSLNALEVLVITHSAIAAVTDEIRQDWQKRGIGGIVSAVDPAAGTVTLSVSGFGGKRSIVVQVSKTTVIRHYAPDSAKPEDAKVITLSDIHVDDQLRARGNRSADGTELAAEEIYTGVFPQFSALVKSVDASAGTLSVQDLVTKKNVQLKINTDSQMHKLPAEMAQRFAMRMKAALPPGTPGAAPSSSSSPAAAKGAVPATANGANGATAGAPSGMGQGGARMSGARAGGGGFDLSRLLDQTPTVTLAVLHKGDAIYVLTTQGTPAGSTVIKLVAGVEPILEAAPNAGQAMMLAPWSLGGGAPGGDTQ
jgi:hypothetical protein